MLLKIDLSSFISNSTRYTLVSIDPKEYKTIGEIVAYILQLFGHPNNGNVLLFAGKWFIHGCQPSVILQGLDEVLRLDVEDEPRKTSKKQKRKKDGEKSLPEEPCQDIETNISSFNQPKLYRHIEGELANDVDAREVTHTSNVNSSIRTSDKCNKRKRKHDAASENLNTDDNEMLALGEENGAFNKRLRTCTVLKVDGPVSSDIEQSCNTSCADYVDYTDFSIPLKKKRSRKHNKVVKRQKQIAYRLAEKDHSSHKNMDDIEVTSMLNDSKIEPICIEESYNLVTHSTPTTDRIDKTRVFGNATQTSICNGEATPAVKLPSDYVNRGPPIHFKPVSEPTENDEVIFTELLMLQNCIYPVTLDPKCTAFNDTYQSSTLIQEPGNTLVSDLNIVPVATESDIYQNVIDSIGLEEESHSLSRNSCDTSKDKAISSNTTDKCKPNKIYPKKKNAYVNSVGSILEFLRSKENGIPLNKTSLPDSLIANDSNTETTSNFETTLELKDENMSAASTPSSTIIIPLNIIDLEPTGSTEHVQEPSSHTTFYPTDKEIITVVDNTSHRSSIEIQEDTDDNGFHTLEDDVSIISPIIDLTNESDKLKARSSVLETSPEENSSNSKVKVEMYPVISTLPKTGDIIGFKTMELDESFCPVYSQYQVGKVNSSTGPVLSLYLADMNVGNREIDESVVTEIDYREIFDVRLIFP